MIKDKVIFVVGLFFSGGLGLFFSHPEWMYLIIMPELNCQNYRNMKFLSEQSFLLLEITFIANFISVEIGFFRFFYFVKVSEQQVIFVATGSETYLFFYQSSFFIFIIVFIGAIIPFVKVARKLSSIYFVELKYFVLLEWSCDTKTFCHTFWFHFCWRIVFRSLGNEKISTFLLILFF